MGSTKAYVVFGLTYGDEGKGTTVDWLCRTFGAKLAVRYGGGPQAAHNVVADDGRWHCFAQLASGLLAPGTNAVLARPMLVEPEALAVEAGVLEKKGVVRPLWRTSVDAGCAVVTPMHKMVNQMAEIARGAARHGSCGMGVGQAALDRERGLAVTVREILDGGAGEKLRLIHEAKMAEARQLLKAAPTAEMRETFDYFRRRCDRRRLAAILRDACRRADMKPLVDAAMIIQLALAAGKTVVFEGAQGALLDRRHGFWPYVTKTKTTGEEALDQLVGCVGQEETEKVGIIRAFATRHGAGPFVTEDARLSRRLADRYNPENRWQGRFRVGWLDLLATRYGLAMNAGADWLMLTNLDRLSPFAEFRVCVSYRYDGPLGELDRFFEWEPLGRDVARITAFRPPPFSSEPDSDALTRLLFRCRPLEWRTFPGWRRKLTPVKSRDDLPAEVLAFIGFLESEAGLATPIGAVSLSPRPSGKLWLR